MPTNVIRDIRVLQRYRYTFGLIGLLLLAMALARLRGGDVAGVARLIGTRSAQEEVEDEIQALQQRQTEAERG